MLNQSGEDRKHLLIEIQRKFASGEWVYTKHAVDRTIERGIWSYEVEEAIEVSEIIRGLPQGQIRAKLPHSGMDKEETFAYPGHLSTSRGEDQSDHLV